MTTPPRRNLPVTTLDDQPEALIGRVLDGRFRLDSVLNAGGMGVVYRGTQLSVQRPIAVKIIKPSLASHNDLVARFIQEIEVTGRLTHPNIVQFIDTGRDLSGLTYIVMELVSGETFRDALIEARLSLLEILHVFVQVCDALIEAHHLGIIHRDLKFENIMMVRHQDDRIHVKVLDFGVAKRLTQHSDITRAGEVPGTPGIIAPELLDGSDASPQSDLYSLGILLFTALTGRAPYEGQNDYELMRAHKNEDIPNLYELVGDHVPEVIIELAYELMQKNPNERPESAEVTRDRLERIIGQLERQMMDHPRYVPPSREHLRPFHAPRLQAIHRSQEFLARPKMDQEQESSSVAPMSVVTILIIVIIVMAVLLVYLLYRQHLLTSGV